MLVRDEMVLVGTIEIRLMAVVPAPEPVRLWRLICASGGSAGLDSACCGACCSVAISNVTVSPSTAFRVVTIFWKLTMPPLTSR